MGLRCFMNNFDIKYYNIQKILWFIPILNLFTFFIWAINLFIYRKYISRVKEVMLAFLTFVAAYISWRLLSISLTVLTFYIENAIIDTVLTCVYYYLCGIVLTIVWMISEKKLINMVNKS